MNLSGIILSGALPRENPAIPHPTPGEPPIICGCGPIRLATKKSAKPADAVNGSPETVFDDGSSRAANVTGQWAEKIVRVIPDTDSPIAIRRAIDAALDDQDLDQFATVAYESDSHGLMLGSLDSAWEVETDTAIEAPAYEEPEQTLARRTGAVRLLAEVRYYSPGFDHLPYRSARDTFLSLNPISRRAFDVLDDAAKRRSFTVAGMTQKKMLRTCQRELARQVSQGADLREFRKFVEKRLVSAGWTPANPSHVETIFRNNVQRSYGTGRLEHQLKPSVVKARPFWRWLGVQDGPPRQRRSHQRAHGMVMRADNLEWTLIYPPAGHCCRCRITTLPAKYQGEVVASILALVPNLVDKGWTAGTIGLAA